MNISLDRSTIAAISSPLEWLDYLKSNDLQTVNLAGADLSELDLDAWDLRNADLSGANLTRASLDDTKLSGANLTEAILTRANLEYADLRDANLTKADLQLANLTEANLTRANLEGANLSHAELEDTCLQYANLRGVNLKGLSFQDISLEGTIFDFQIQDGLLERIADTILCEPDSFDMSFWHATVECGTTHCIAGLACHLNPVAKRLERIYNTEIAGLLTLGVEAHSHFWDTKFMALNWLATRTGKELYQDA